MRIGLLGLQGAFADHIPHLKRCGTDCVVVRDIRGLSEIDRLIIPGGESTVMDKFLNAYAMRAPLIQHIAAGMPVWGVCAGAILLAEQVDGMPGTLGALPVSVIRNAYGRQLASDIKPIDIPLLGICSYPAVFIRAPKINLIRGDVAIHAHLDGDPVFIQKDHLMATTFHPELMDDDRFHRYFLSL